MHGSIPAGRSRKLTDRFVLPALGPLLLLAGAAIIEPVGVPCAVLTAEPWPLLGSPGPACRSAAADAVTSDTTPRVLRAAAAAALSSFIVARRFMRLRELLVERPWLSVVAADCFEPVRVWRVGDARRFCCWGDMTLDAAGTQLQITASCALGNAGQV